MNALSSRRFSPILFAVLLSLPVVVATAAAEPVICPYCDLTGHDYSGRDLRESNFSGAVLEGASFTGARLNGTVFVGADLRNARFDRAVLEPSPKGSVSFVGADLRGASFSGARARKANFQYSKGAPRDLPDAVFAPARAAETARSDEEIVCGTADLSGLTRRVYVATTGTDGNRCGATPDAPCRTLKKGIARCAPSGCGVLVAWGEYTPAAAVELRDGVAVYGGCVPESTEGAENLFSLVHAPAGGHPAMSARGIRKATRVQGFQLQGTETEKGSVPSLALTSRESPGLHLAKMELVAGRGFAGARGADGTPGRQGGDARHPDPGKNPSCPHSNGGAGGARNEPDVIDLGGFEFRCSADCQLDGPDSDETYSCPGEPGGPGDTGGRAKGGRGGQNNCGDCPTRTYDGKNGEPGAAGSCGSPGKGAGTAAGSFSGTVWTPGRGGDGTDGGDAGGGGGGGGGGYTAGSCFGHREWEGNHGGGGGAGGCGGGAGGGGHQGGGAFGLVVVGSAPQVAHSRIVGGRGGDGGAGGDGKPGGNGGRHGSHGHHSDGGSGGHGKDGGHGGAGAGGAGGDGGPAITLAQVGSSEIDLESTSLYQGTGGAAGAAGSGSSVPACSTAAGEDGKDGTTANIYQYR